MGKAISSPLVAGETEVLRILAMEVLRLGWAVDVVVLVKVLDVEEVLVFIFVCGIVKFEFEETSRIIILLFCGCFGDRNGSGITVVQGFCILESIGGSSFKIM